MDDEKLYSEHLTNMKERSIAAAIKAIDYMDGDHLDHIEAILDSENTGIKKWRERGVMVVWTNNVGRIIEKSALTYQKQPDRQVMIGDAENEELSASYKEILTEAKFHTTMIDADHVTRLLKTTLILIQYLQEEGVYTFDILSQHNSDAIYDKATGKITSLLYASGEVGPNGGQVYYHWTDEYISKLEYMNDSLKEIDVKEENTYDFIPVAKFFDTKPPRNGLWAKPVYRQLTNFNDALSMFNIEVKFNSRFGTIGMPVTNMSVPDGTVMGVDAIVELGTDHPDITPFFEYRLPPANVSEFKEWAREMGEEIGYDWGVNIKVAGEGSADSGFKLIVEELPTLMLWAKRQPMAADAEREIFSIVKRIDTKLVLGTFPEDASINVEFHEPELPVNEKEKWEIAQGEMALGVLSKREYLAKKFPGWTDEQIDEYLALIETEKGGTLDLGLGIEEEEEE